MIFGFFTVEGVRAVAAHPSQVHGDGTHQRDALVGRSEEHVELNAAGITRSQKRLSVERAERIEHLAGGKKTRVEKVRAHAACFGFVAAKAKNVGSKGKFNELRLNAGHDGHKTKRKFKGKARRANRMRKLKFYDISIIDIP